MTLPSKSASPCRAKCPICKSPTHETWRPFCSRRCADIDLSRWLGGTYAISGGNTDADEDGDDTRATHAARGFERNGGEGDGGNGDM